MDAVEVVNVRCHWLLDQFLSQVLPVTKQEERQAAIPTTL